MDYAYEISLFEKYNDTLTVVGEKHLKSYNLGTVKNLIIHFENIPLRQKENIYISITNYLTLIKGIPVPEDGKESDILFRTHILPIIRSYMRLGFIANLSWFVFIIFIILATSILFISTFSFEWYILTYLLISIVKLRSWIKQKQHKVYGSLY